MAEGFMAGLPEDGKMASYEELPPKADAMIASLRAIGYDLPMAIADIIDNSIFARAKNVWIDFDWEDGNPWVRVKDDGLGMSESELREAMRLGSRGPNETRDPDDLGRFGLGLKTASFSQCRVFTVRTKTKDGTISTRCWDLNVIEETKKWHLSMFPPDGADALLDVLDDVDNGTVVLWQHLDRVIDSIEDPEEGRAIFFNKFNEVVRHLEMVFHRFLSGSPRLKITIGRTPLKPWDPFLLSNQFTQELSTERYEDGSVKIVPYVLPHISKRSAIENVAGAGPRGWNAQQGFYIYRNKRLIVSGGYLDFNIKPEEHYKLARILVDLKNNMDNEWRIDVRKAVVIPPDRLRPELQKVARATREEAVRVYRARIGKSRSRGIRNNRDIWIRRRRGEKIAYEINRENEALKRILSELNAPVGWIAKLFGAIERTVPHREIVIDSAESEDCHVDLPPDAWAPEVSLIDLCLDLYREKLSEGRSHEEAVGIILAIEPFNTHPAFRAALDKEMEDRDR